MEQSPRHEVPYESLAQVVAICGQALERADLQGDCKLVVGTVTVESPKWRVDSLNAENDVRAVWPTTVDGIWRCISPGEGLPEGFHADLGDHYLFEDRHMSFLDTSWIGVQALRAGTDETALNELVTVTTIVFPSSNGTVLHRARILSKYGNVGCVEMSDVPAECLEMYMRCRQLLGETSSAHRLLRGRFESHLEFEQTLDEINRMVLRKYPQDLEAQGSIQTLLRKVYEAGTEIGADRNGQDGILPEQLADLMELTSMLAGVWA